MANEKSKKKETVKPHPKVKYEDTMSFEVIDRMMRDNKGVWIKSQ